MQYHAMFVVEMPFQVPPKKKPTGPLPKKGEIATSPITVRSWGTVRPKPSFCASSIFFEDVPPALQGSLGRPRRRTLDIYLSAALGTADYFSMDYCVNAHMFMIVGCSVSTATTNAGRILLHRYTGPRCIRHPAENMDAPKDSGPLPMWWSCLQVPCVVNLIDSSWHRITLKASRKTGHHCLQIRSRMTYAKSIPILAIRRWGSTKSQPPNQPFESYELTG